MRDSITSLQSPSIRPTRRFKLPLIAAILVVIGCSPDSPLSGSEGIVVETKTVATQDSAPAAEAPAVPAEPAAQTYSQKLAAAMEKAAAAKDAVMEQLSDAGESSGQAASDSITWATEMFSSLKEQGFTTVSYTHLTLPTTPYV